MLCVLRLVWEAWRWPSSGSSLAGCGIEGREGSCAGERGFVEEMGSGLFFCGEGPGGPCFEGEVVVEASLIKESRGGGFLEDERAGNVVGEVCTFEEDTCLGSFSGGVGGGSEGE